MILNLLTSAFALYRKFTTPPNWRVIQESLEYDVIHDVKYEVEDDFWATEAGDWDDRVLTSFWVDCTGRGVRNTVVPNCVSKTILRVKYWYNGKVYKMVTDDLHAPFPPDQKKSMTFSLPFIAAWLCDEDDKPVKNVTEKIRRLAGPHRDFHHQRVALRDVLYYDEDYLREVYPKLKITNALGLHKVVSTLDGYTTDFLQF